MPPLLPRGGGASVRRSVGARGQAQDKQFGAEEEEEEEEEEVEEVEEGEEEQEEEEKQEGEVEEEQEEEEKQEEEEAEVEVVEEEEEEVEEEEVEEEGGGWPVSSSRGSSPRKRLESSWRCLEGPQVPFLDGVLR
ncbi:unnamed protein product [Boreogadus saida]